MDCFGNSLIVSIFVEKSFYMVEIDELPESLREPFGTNLREISQLRYVVEMSEMLCPNVGFYDYGHFFMQGGTCIFLKRYFEGSIDTSFKSAYQSHTDLHNTLNVYGIDPTAFWYLILFIKDYVDDESSGKKMSSNAYTDIFNFASSLNEMGFCEDPLTGEYQGCKDQGMLKLKVGKHWLEIDDDKALYGIFCALCSYLRKVQPKRRKEIIDGVLEEVYDWEYDIDEKYLFTTSLRHDREVITIPETYKISYFTTYMKKFLNSYKTNNKDWSISKDKWLLISRVIYIIRYSSDERYNTRRKPGNMVDLDFLKNNYRKDKYKYLVCRTIYV